MLPPPCSRGRARLLGMNHIPYFRREAVLIYNRTEDRKEEGDVSEGAVLGSNSRRTTDWIEGTSCVATPTAPLLRLESSLSSATARPKPSGRNSLTTTIATKDSKNRSGEVDHCHGARGNGI
jgi:hypothetical protein